ncbi:MAG: protein TolQ [Desulfobacterales bacterium S3730MH5]|nr:MAG: protein TolQ [Desulfobacterales bacterium S3730MH5]OEU78911.1 MAG: protein TolQ [Desulfobacterales bacterium S5133MH4]
MPVSASNDIVQMILHSGLMVRFVLLLLLFFSVVSWAIIFAKYRSIGKARKQSADFLDLFWNSRGLSEALAAAKHLRYSPIAKIFSVAYLELKKVNKSQSSSSGVDVTDEVLLSQKMVAVDNIKRALRRAVNMELTVLGRAIPFLATTGNTTPFIGLFGTVWGIMNSFRGIGLKGSASLAVVAPGISEALIATAAGLAAAIPAVVAYNYFTNKVRVLESEMHNFSADFLNLIERDLMRRKDK